LRILFLDDDIHRHKILASRMIGHTVTYVFDARSCLDKLGEAQYDIVMLDHDLGGPESENQIFENVEDGRFVVRWVSANADLFRQTQFVVHSLNFVGRSSMVASLREAGLNVVDFPFAWSKLEFKEKENL
jgi:CheY-like chemotaxis protein